MASFSKYRCEDFEYHRVGDVIQVDTRFRISLEDSRYRYTVTILPGFRTDGGSIPKIFGWFAKGWIDGNCRYNGCFVLHDALYATGYTSRAIADDMLRCSLRECGMDRLHASTICWAVNTFACRHYGPENDDQDNYDFVRFDVREL